MKRVRRIVVSAVSTVMFAVSLAKAGVAETDGFLSSLGGGMNFSEMFSQADKRDDAIGQGRWYAAVCAGRDLLNSSGGPDFNRASDMLCLSMLYWNDDNPAMAKSTLEKTIHILRYGSQLGEGGAAAHQDA